MKIVVNATALVARGSYSLIKDFVAQVTAESESLAAKGIQLLILVSVQALTRQAKQGVQIRYETFSKRSLLHRIYFERWMLPKILEAEGADAYLSLQNTSLYKGKVPQFVLVHQSLHLGNLQFGELEPIHLFKYGLLMDFFTKTTIQGYRGILVQTQWVKDILKARYGYGGKIQVVRPGLEDFRQCNDVLPRDVREKLETTQVKFLYVTSKEKYKNNARLIAAVQGYNQSSNCTKIELFLTMEGKDQVDVKYLGKVPYRSMCSLYRAADVFIFPSLTETLGLPLMEAMQFRLPILASDLPFAREICKREALYFDPRAVASIRKAIEKCMLEGFYKRPKAFERPTPVSRKQSYMEYITFIEDTCKELS